VGLVGGFREPYLIEVDVRTTVGRITAVLEVGIALIEVLIGFALIWFGVISGAVEFALLSVGLGFIAVVICTVVSQSIHTGGVKALGLFFSFVSIGLAIAPAVADLLGTPIK
jgi:hypothetical protein